MAAYVNAFNVPFHFDGTLLIQENPAFLKGLPALLKAIGIAVIPGRAVWEFPWKASGQAALDSRPGRWGVSLALV